jgi:hypothetical protein
MSHMLHHPVREYYSHMFTWCSNDDTRRKRIPKTLRILYLVLIESCIIVTLTTLTLAFLWLVLIILAGSHG